LLSGFFVAQLLVVNDVLEIEVSGNHISGGHDMVVVHGLDEGLNLGASLDLLLAHAACNSQSISLDSGDESVGELLVLNRTAAKASSKTHGFNKREALRVAMPDRETGQALLQNLPSFHRRAVSQ